MKERIERNKETFYEAEADKGRIIDPSRIFEASIEQQELTKKFLLPYRDEILKDAMDLRLFVDKILKERREQKYDTKYPIGHCYEITQEFLNQLTGEVYDKSKIGFAAIKNFIRAGGIVNAFWSINKNDDGDSFQNALQLGSSILDVARDTLDGKGRKVAFFDTVDESPLEPVNSYEQAAKVVESYWGYTVFPNVYFPELALAYPMLITEPLKNNQGKESPISGVFLLDSGIQGQMLSRDFLSEDALLRRMKDAQYFLTKSEYAKRRLPVDAVSFSENKNPWLGSLRKEDNETFSVSFDPNDLDNVFARFHVGTSREIFMKQVEEIHTIVKMGEKCARRPLFFVRTPEIKKLLKKKADND